MRAVLLTALACALLGALAPAVGATTLTYPASLGVEVPYGPLNPYISDIGPRLAGPSTVWVDTPFDGRVQVTSAALDGLRTVIYDRPPGLAPAVELATAPNAVGIVARTYRTVGSKSPRISVVEAAMLAGPPGAKLTAVNGCLPPAASPGISIALTEAAFLTARESCNGGYDGILSRARTPRGYIAPTYLRVPVAPRELRAAGVFIAWRDPASRRIVVYNKPEVVEAYSVDGNGIPDGSWDVQADGKLAAYRRSGNDCSIVWASREDPALHPMAAPCFGGPPRIRIAADRIAYRDGQAIVGRSLDGAAAVLGRGPGLVGGFDLDPTRVAYGLAGCRTDTVVVRDLTDGDPPPGRADVCRATLASRQVRIPSDRTLRLGLTCAGGCRGRLQLVGERRKKNGRIANVLLLDLPFEGGPDAPVDLARRADRTAIGDFGCVATAEARVELSVRQPTGIYEVAKPKRVRLVFDRQRGCPSRPGAG